jgi:hypothetical protein
MKIALDLDNTITASKESIEFFSILTNLLIANNSIYIITNREIGTEQEVAQELDYLEIEYNEIIITAKKAEYIKENNINIFFENEDESFLEISKNVVIFKIRESGNFSFSEKKWLGNKRTTKMI